MKSKGLGRGLDALLLASTPPESDVQRQLPLARLQPGKYQPRTQMDAASLEELAASIRAQGVIQPILIRPLGERGFGEEERYEIIAGERRWRAAALAGLAEIPVLIRQIPDDKALAIALIENIQRENLNPLEEAQGLQRLIDEFGLTHQLAADAVGRSRSAASNLLRLLQLSPKVQEALMAGQLDMGHARALLTLPTPMQELVSGQVVDKGLSVREVEKLVQRLQQSTPTPVVEPAPRNRDLERLEEALSDRLGADVVLQVNAKNRGKMVISFASLEELEGILARLGANELAEI